MISSRDMAVGVKLTVPRWEGTFSDDHIVLHDFECEVIALREMTFIAALNPKTTPRKAFRQTNGRVAVSYRVVGMRPDRIKHPDSKEEGSRFMPTRPRAPRKPVDPEADKRRTEKAAKANQQKGLERRAEFAPQLAAYYRRGVRRTEVMKLEHMSPGFLIKVEKEHNLPQPPLYLARLVKPDGIEYFANKRALVAAYGVGDNAARTELVPGVGKIEQGRWVETDTGYRESKG